MYSLKVKIQRDSGFTLIELMVVVAIMVILSTIVIINNNTDRSVRNINIAQRELITNIRKIQAYALSSRSLPSGQLVQYYAMKLDSATPDRYTIQALYNVNSTSTTPTLVDLETITLPGKIRFAPSAFTVVTPSLSSTTTPGCLLIAFQLPFAKTLAGNGCTLVGGGSGPAYSISSTNPTIDNYRSLINYSQNIVNYLTTADSQITIVLQDISILNRTRTVKVQGVSGIVNDN